MTMHAPAIELDEALKALANPVRLKILEKMRDPEANFPGQDHPYEFGVCAGKIEASCGLSQSTISAHLGVLQQAGLITGRRVGQWIFYKRDDAAIAAFLRHLGQAL